MGNQHIVNLLNIRFIFNISMVFLVETRFPPIDEESSDSPVSIQKQC